jgi:hypothetical protein
VAPAGHHGGVVERVVLHIGMHKTGSSSIQRSLVGYDDGHAFYGRFDRPNHSLPLHTVFAAAPANHHLWVREGLDEAAVERKRAEALDCLDRDLTRPDREVLVLSGEDVGVLADDEKDRLVAHLRRHGAQVDVVAYVREPAAFTASSFQQGVRGGSLLPLRHGTVRPSYRRRLERFLELAPGAVTVRAFDRDRLAGGSVVRDFCDIAGLDFGRLRDETANESLSIDALKLLLVFNASNACSGGDRIVMGARRQLVATLRSLYADGEIPAERFACVADDSELEWLESATGIALPPAARTALDGWGEADLDRWLRDLTDVDLEPLDAELGRLGVAGRFPGAAPKLSRLYYALVVEQQRRLVPDDRRLRAADIDRLRDIALGIADGGSPDKDDAIALMTIAHRARPDGARIRAKLEEWGALPD